MTAAVRRLVSRLAPDALPAYVYDLGALCAHAAAVRAALPERVELYYAAKANPAPEILVALAGSVDGYEVSSGGELTHVHRVLPHARLAFGGPGKTPAELAEALRIGVGRWHLESEHELRQLAALLADRPGRTVDLLLRVNVPVRPGSLDAVALTMGGRPTPFGLDPEQAGHCVRLLSRPGFEQLRLRGVHAHLASGLDASAHLAVTEQILDWSAELAGRHSFELAEVNAGGGMAVDYTDPARRFDWTAFGTGLAKLMDRHPALRLRIEPGRALTAYCGYYATEVLDVKQSHGRDFAVLRGGTHHLRTPAARGHDQPFTVLSVTQWPYPWARPAVTTGRATLTGQLCTPKDVLAHEAPVHLLRTGDRVVFELAGAYAWNISHHDFLMHPRPGFHFLGPGQPATPR